MTTTATFKTVPHANRYGYVPQREIGQGVSKVQVTETDDGYHLWAWDRLVFSGPCHRFVHPHAFASHDAALQFRDKVNDHGEIDSSLWVRQVHVASFEMAERSRKARDEWHNDAEEIRGEAEINAY